jgi:sphinganine-1-phosphate aldolase
MSSVVSSVIQSGKDIICRVDDHLTGQSPSKIIAYSILNTAILSAIWSYYKDIDTTLAHHFKQKFFDVVKRIPFLNAKIESELKKALKNFEDDITKANKGIPYQLSLPQFGLTRDEVISKVEEYIKMESVDWKGGVLSGCVYGGDSDLTELSTAINQKFVWSNPMHADVFPDVRKMEAEVVRMVCTMFNGDEDSCGTMTTGGTESIMLACKAYRDFAYSKGIKKPEMIIPITAHAAFEKAADFFKIRIHHVPVNPKTMKVDINKVRSYINSSTCMVS